MGIITQGKLALLDICDGRSVELQRISRSLSETGLLQ